MSGYRRTAARLADGRQLLLYDRPGGPERVVDDRRPLAPFAAGSQVRRDPVLDEPVVIASHRQDRTFLPPPDECPLCPSRDGRMTEIPLPGYEVAVFENRFPSLWAADGRCEVIAFSDDHDARFADLGPDRAELVLAAWTDRTRDLLARPEVQQVFCFENRGQEIGVTLTHPHGQIYGYPFLTPRTARMLEVAQRQHAATGRVPADEVPAAERADGRRVVAESAHWTAFVPYAARWPVEVHLYPHRRVPDLPALTDAERSDLAGLYLDVLQRFDRLYAGRLPYIAAWHQAPKGAARDLLGLHGELFSIRRSADKLKYLAGSESAMGAFIGDVLPEQVAERLRALA